MATTPTPEAAREELRNLLLTKSDTQLASIDSALQSARIPSYEQAARLAEGDLIRDGHIIIGTTSPAEASALIIREVLGVEGAYADVVTKDLLASSDPAIKGRLQALLSSAADQAVLNGARTAGEKVVGKFWNDKIGDSTTKGMFAEIDRTEFGASINTIDRVVKWEEGDAAAEISKTLELKVNMLKNSMGDKRAKLQKGKDLQIEIQRTKDQIFKLHKDINAKSSGVMKQITDNVEKATGEMANFAEALKSCDVIDGDTINRLKTDHLSPNIQNLVKWDETKEVVTFAGNVTKLPGGRVEGTAAESFANAFSGHVDNYAEHAAERVNEIMKGLTDGLMERAKALEVVQGQVHSHSGAPARGKMVSGAASDVAKSGDKAAAETTAKTEGKASRSLALGTGIGVVGGIVLRRALFSQPDEENSLVKDGIAGVVGGLVGRTVHSVMGGKGHISEKAEYSALADGIAHIR